VFGQFGKIRNINIPVDAKGRPRGLAFMTYMNHDLAANALRESSKGILIGQRKLRVEVFKPLETLEKDREKENEAKRLPEKKRLSSPQSSSPI
jgi:RNA recognition motif-containing protein